MAFDTRCASRRLVANQTNPYSFWVSAPFLWFFFFFHIQQPSGCTSTESRIRFLVFSMLSGEKYFLGTGIHIGYSRFGVQGRLEAAR